MGKSQRVKVGTHQSKRKGRKEEKNVEQRGRKEFPRKQNRSNVNGGERERERERERRNDQGKPKYPGRN